MGNLAPDTMIDASLDYVAGSNYLVICSGSPTTFTDAYTNLMLAKTPISSGSFTKADASGGGRQITIATKSGITVSSSGTALFVGLVETTGSTLRYGTTCASQVLAVTDIINTSAWTITIGDPVDDGESLTENIIFDADFESGDFSYFDATRGEVFGKGVYYSASVVSSPAIGNYSAALSIGSGASTAMYLFAYTVPATPLAVYSADYYITITSVPADWWSVWQWKSVNETYDKPVISINILEDAGKLQLVTFYTPDGDSSNPTEMFGQEFPIAFPSNQWVNIKGYFYSKADNTGYVQIYQDDVLVFEKTGFKTKPGTESDDVLWSIQSYADEVTPNPLTIYVDNMTIAELS